MTDAKATIRLDKWLWQARFFKSRSIASGLVSAGKVRVDGTPVSKPARTVGAGNVLTFAQERQVRVIRILDCGTRRGPATEARTLYEDLSPPVDAESANPRFDGGGRPTGKDRRDMNAARRRDDPFALE